ncbi:hypothetical protein PPGU19_094300 (plasmid) [Paraburkholderia sp. PGU19]|nr:hypothetical protein PPGU19_094300 [Paraburkholderia sp. PGU19]
MDTGCPALSEELPGRDWPVGALVDLLVSRQASDGLCLQYIGLSPNRMLWVETRKTADARTLVVIVGRLEWLECFETGHRRCAGSKDGSGSTSADHVRQQSAEAA